MSQGKRAGDDEFLMRILEGEISPESEEAKLRFAQDPSLRQRVDELEDLRRALDAAASTAEDDMQSQEGGDAVAAERVRSQVRELAQASPAGKARSVSESPSGRPPGRIPRWAIGLAAGLLVLFALRARFTGDEPPPRAPMTLGSSLEGLAPTGSVDRFQTFEWTFQDIGEGRFEVQVFHSDTGDLVTIERGLKQARWAPDPARVAKWPSKIRWTVSAYDASGSFLDSAETSTERSRP